MSRADFFWRGDDGAWQSRELPGGSPPDPAAPESQPRYLVGLDLAQVGDYTALVVAEQREAPPEPGRPARGRSGPRWAYAIRHVQRWPHGTGYPTIVADVQRLLATPELRGRADLIVDGSGVGRGIVDYFFLAGLTPLAVTITSGATAHQGEYSYWNVPKRDLVGVVQLLLQEGRLAWSKAMPEERVLAAELQNFRVKLSPSGHDSYGAGAAGDLSAWRDGGANDDVVLATAVSLWAGEMGLPAKAFVF